MFEKSFGFNQSNEVSMNKLLVIIVSYNSMPWVNNCYKSLFSSTIPCDVVLIDNASTDGTVEYVSSNFPNVRIVKNERNLGFGKANNIGLQIAKDEGYDYAYLLNQDAWVSPETFEILIETSKSHPEYGVLSPMQLSKGSKKMDDKFASYVLGCHQQVRPFLVEDLFFGILNDVYEVSFVMAAHWLITRKCFESVGGFSPSFPHYGEDDNYLQRVNFWGMKVGIAPRALAVHDRADQEWSPEKNLYIQRYICAIKDASNPLTKTSLWPYIKANAKNAIKTRNVKLWNYARKLFFERKMIEENYRRSLSSCAFLY